MGVKTTVKHSKKRIASIIVLSVIIAAGALFTAVYDVLYKYHTTNTTILNAETVDNTGETYWGVVGSRKNCDETTTFSFDQGTYMVIFGGQISNYQGSFLEYGVGASCITFYKGNSMTVTIGVPGGKGSAEDGSRDGGGATYVQSNFALPIGTNAGTAIASGAGASMWQDLGVEQSFTASEAMKIMDGTFAGFGDDYWSVIVAVTKGGVTGEPWPGTPASQNMNGLRSDGTRTSNGGWGGGAGYYDGGGGAIGGVYDYWKTKSFAGGGSCSPNCYPIASSDIQIPFIYSNNAGVDEHLIGTRVRSYYTTRGYTYFYRIDPLNEVSGNETSFGSEAKLQVSGTSGGLSTPNGILNRYDVYENLDTGLEVGWVYSCSEDGEKWGASSERKCRRHLKFNTARCYNECVNRHFLSE